MSKVCGHIEDYAVARENFTQIILAVSKPELQPNGYYHWHEFAFNKKQHPRLSIDTVKRDVLASINAETDRRILQDFVWNELPVWLSVENQMNFKAAYDLAVQTQGASLPVTFKFGDDNAPQYHTFEMVEDFTDFYMNAVAHINKCFTEGWRLKDSIEWEKIEEEIRKLYADK